MGSLDEQEAEANVGGPVTALEASEVVAYLRDLPHLRDDAPGSRRALAEALFRSCRGPGIAPDVDRAGAISDRRVGVSRASAGYGRGERGSADTPSPLLLLW